MSQGDTIPHLLQAVTGTFAEPLAIVIEGQRAAIRDLAATAAQAKQDRDTAERQVRDLAHENDRLRRENARLKSLTSTHSTNRG